MSRGWFAHWNTSDFNQLISWNGQDTYCTSPGWQDQGGQAEESHSSDERNSGHDCWGAMRPAWRPFVWPQRPLGSQFGTTRKHWAKQPWGSREFSYRGGVHDRWSMRHHVRYEPVTKQCSPVSKSIDVGFRQLSLYLNWPISFWPLLASCPSVL